MYCIHVVICVCNVIVNETKLYYILEKTMNSIEQNSEAYNSPAVNSNVSMCQSLSSIFTTID